MSGVRRLLLHLLEILRPLQQTWFEEPPTPRNFFDRPKLLLTLRSGTASACGFQGRPEDRPTCPRPCMLPHPCSPSSASNSTVKTIISFYSSYFLINLNYFVGGRALGKDHADHQENEKAVLPMPRCCQVLLPLSKVRLLLLHLTTKARGTAAVSPWPLSLRQHGSAFLNKALVRIKCFSCTPLVCKMND